MLESLRIPTIELTTNLAGCLDTSLADLRESEGHNGVLSQVSETSEALPSHRLKCRLSRVYLSFSSWTSSVLFSVLLLQFF